MPLLYRELSDTGMKTLLIHLIAFWNVVVMNCIQPVNWKYCYRIDQWLVPDLVEGYQVWTQQKHPYQNEKDYLRKSGRVVDGTGLENQRR
tara:strand:+ start:249 stop:518 length:270 start_codon:yes stop_codon:yes gene_type:complete